MYNTASRTPPTPARANLRDRRADRTVDWADLADQGLLLRAKHAVFDRLVYRKLRAALGGNCRAAVSGGAPLKCAAVTSIAAPDATIYEDTA